MYCPITSRWRWSWAHLLKVPLDVVILLLLIIRCYLLGITAHGITPYLRHGGGKVLVSMGAPASLQTPSTTEATGKVNAVNLNIESWMTASLPASPL